MTSKLLAACVLLTPCAATAGEVYLNTLDSASSDSVVVEREHGPYVGAWIGASTGGGATATGKLRGASVDGGTGFAAGLKFGYYYRLPFALRPSLELELAYLRDSFDVSGAAEFDKNQRGSVSGGGDLHGLMGAVNLIVQLDLAAYRDQVGDFLAAFHPYVGAGIGGAYTSIDGFEVRAKGSEGRKDLKVGGGSSLDFAHQFMAGVEFEFDDEFSIFGEWKRISIEGTGSNSIRDYERNIWTVGAKLGY